MSSCVTLSSDYAGNMLNTVNPLAYRIGMEWATRKFTEEQLDEAGRMLIDKQSTPVDVMIAIERINNWRAAHAFPLNTMQMRLRDKAYKVDRYANVAQRIKRLHAIESKLRRLKHVSLSNMQDIGGCRAVVGTNIQVKKLVKDYRSGRIRHEVEREYDYIDKPSSHGYRSFHLVYRYYSDRREQYNGQRIEIQIRSRLQHAWATTVEAIDTFIGQQLKIHQGAEDWERFFALMGTRFAMLERAPLVPDTPKNPMELVKELRTLTKSLNVEDRLLAIGTTAQFIGERKVEAHYYLVDLDIDKRKLRISRYSKAQADEATKRLAELELEYRLRSDRDVLLVSVSSVKELLRMYPNYRADTRVFLTKLKRVLE